MMLDQQLEAGAKAIKDSSAIIITAGAGMGVDSGLPDFRGDHGFWNAYPMYRRLGLSFVETADPAHFERDPAFGWGFYGHRANLYRDTVPHGGFRILKKWIADFGLDHFVVTSNVDGQFQKAGFQEESILEIHGSIHHLQCLAPCSSAIWENNEKVAVDLDTMRAKTLPGCIHCAGIARPNILMFNDYSWISDRTRRQERSFDEFITDHRGDRVVVLEMGAGSAIPSIRMIGERLAAREGALLVRINPREAQTPEGQVSIPTGALTGLEGINDYLG